MWAVVKASVQLLVFNRSYGDTVIIINTQQRGPFWPGGGDAYAPIAPPPLATGLRILLASQTDWRGQPGRARITWLSTIQRDLRHHHRMLSGAADLAQNRPL